VWPAKSAPRSLLVNRFIVLDVEEVNTEIREPIDAPPFSPSALVRTALPRRPKWEKRLPRRLSANTLDACRMSIVLSIKIGTTDTSEVHSVKALLDSGATGNFIDKDFVHTKGISTWSISRPIPVFNVDGVTLLENFLWKCNMGYTLYPWISLLESTLETSYKPQT